MSEDLKSIQERMARIRAKRGTTDIHELRLSLKEAQHAIGVILDMINTGAFGEARASIEMLCESLQTLGKGAVTMTRRIDNVRTHGKMHRHEKASKRDGSDRPGTEGREDRAAGQPGPQARGAAARGVTRQGAVRVDPRSDARGDRSGEEEPLTRCMHCRAPAPLSTGLCVACSAITPEQQPSAQVRSAVKAPRDSSSVLQSPSVGGFARLLLNLAKPSISVRSVYDGLAPAGTTLNGRPLTLKAIRQLATRLSDEGLVSFDGDVLRSLV